MFRCCVSVTSPAGCEDLDSFSCLRSAVLRLLEWMSTESIWETLDFTPKLRFAECGVCVCCMYLLVCVCLCGGQRQTLGLFLQSVYIYRLMVLKLVSSPDQEASECRGLPVSAAPNGIADTCEIHVLSPMLMGQGRPFIDGAVSSGSMF